MLPASVGSSIARWLMAKSGAGPMPSTPASSSSRTLYFAASDSCVVHLCPCHPTYWRSSSHTAQDCGGVGASSYWVPQVSQMDSGIAAPLLRIVASEQGLACGGGQIGFLRVNILDAVIDAPRG